MTAHRGKAALLLRLAGVSSAELARRLGISKQAASWHLSGQSAETPAELIDAVRALADDATAGEVEAAIEAARQIERAAS